MLAGTIAPEWSGNDIVVNHRLGERGPERRVAAARQLGLGGSDRREPSRSGGPMNRLGVVRSARQRQHRCIESEPLHAAVLDEGQELEGLGCRAPVCHQRGIAGRRDQPTGRSDDCSGYLMDRFGQFATGGDHDEV